MSEEKQKKRGSGKALGTLLNILIGGLCGILIARYMQASGHYKAGSLREAAVFALMMLGFFAAILSQIILHEAGHLVFGLASGYRFVSFRVLSLMWLREGSGIKVKRLSLAGTGGQCLMEPPEMTDGRMPFKLYNQGGAIMNAASGVLFLLLGLLCPNRGLAQTLFWMLTANGLVMAFMNGVPLKLGLVNNDGVNTRELSQNPGALLAFWIQMKANALQSRGMRLKDMPDEWFVIPGKEDYDSGIVSYIPYAASDRLVAQGKHEEASALRKQVEKDFTGMPGVYQAILKSEDIYYELTHENRPEVINELYDADFAKTAKQMRSMLPVLRMECVKAKLHDRDEALFRKNMDAYEKILKDYPYETEGRTDKRLLDEALGKVQA